MEPEGPLDPEQAESDAGTGPEDESARPAEATGDEAADDAQHDDSGLDLARTIARSIASSAGSRPAKPSRRRPGGRSRRGGRPRASGAHPDERDPQPLDTSLGRLVSDQGWALDLTVQQVFGRWQSLVGEEVARHCTPTGFADGRVVVRADSTAWATQLRLLAPTLVRRLNEELGHGSVTVIEVEGPNLPTWKKGRFGTRDGRGPRDTYG